MDHHLTKIAEKTQKIKKNQLEKTYPLDYAWFHYAWRFMVN